MLKCHGVRVSKIPKKIKVMFFGKPNKNGHGNVLLVLWEDARIADFEAFEM